MTFYIQLAGRTIEIHAQYDKVQSMSRDFLTETKTPDFVVDITEADIQAEGAAATPQQQASMESLAVYRKIAEQMLDYHTFLVHGAAVALDGKAYLFAAPSGTGKSTHIRKWTEHLPDAFVVNGDKPLIIIDDQPKICGTPWSGKENWQTNTVVPLKAIVLMERSDENSIREITFKEAFPQLLRQTYYPRDPAKLGITIKLLYSLAPQVKFYHFDFNNQLPDSLDVSFQALTGEKLSNE